MNRLIYAMAPVLLISLAVPVLAAAPTKVKNVPATQSKVKNVRRPAALKVGCDVDVNGTKLPQQTIDLAYDGQNDAYADKTLYDKNGIEIHLSPVLKTDAILIKISATIGPVYMQANGTSVSSGLTFSSGNTIVTALCGLR